MLIALAGLSGAGKSTAIEYLEKLGLGTPYYAGSIVHEEIRARELTITPDNERMIRSELRAEFGMGVFAERAIPHLNERCGSGSMLLDAIYCPEELELYRVAFGERLVTVAITSRFQIRAERARARPERPIEPEMLALRDAFETGKLRLIDVIVAANYSVVNEASLDEFKEALDHLADRLI